MHINYDSKYEINPQTLSTVRIPLRLTEQLQ
jgi:hypothetical protein